MDKPHSSSLLPALMLAIIGAGMVSAAHAGDLQLQLRHGQPHGIRHTAIAVETASVWERALGTWQARLTPAFELAQWSATAARGASSLGALAVLRLSPGEGAWRPFVEAGLGIAAFSNTQIGSRNIGSGFQFTEQLGAGLEWNGKFSLGWRYTHYSNAGLRKPNDGLDAHTLLIGYRF